MSDSQPGTYRHMFEQLTEPAEIAIPPGVPGEILLSLAHVLLEKGYSLPGDYCRFLCEADGMVWNGVELLGAPGARPFSDLDILTGKAVLDPENRIERGKLVVGGCESYIYVHNPQTPAYERYFRGAYTKEARSFADLPGLLTAIFTEKQSALRGYRPAIGARAN